MYTSTKFDSIFAEVAHLVSLDGTALTYGSVEEGGFFALVNIGGRDEIMEMPQAATFDRRMLAASYTSACRLEKYSADMDLFVIISEDDRGFVRCEMHTDLETEATLRFEEMQAEYEEEWDEDED